MSALAEGDIRSVRLHARPVGVAPIEGSSGFVGARIVLSALHASYVVVQLPSLLVPTAALMCGLAAVLVFDAPRRVAWCASAAVVIAVLHARMLPADAPWLVIQLGLAAFVVATATLTLIAPRVRVRIALVLALATVLGCLVGAPAGAGSAIAGGLGGLLAGMRPFSAIEVVMRGYTTDRWLAWTVIKGGR